MRVEYGSSSPSARSFGPRLRLHYAPLSLTSAPERFGDRVGAESARSRRRARFSRLAAARCEPGRARGAAQHLDANSGRGDAARQRGVLCARDLARRARGAAPLRERSSMRLYSSAAHIGQRAYRLAEALPCGRHLPPIQTIRMQLENSSLQQGRQRADLRVLRPRIVGELNPIGPKLPEPLRRARAMRSTDRVPAAVDAARSSCPPTDPETSGSRSASRSRGGPSWMACAIRLCSARGRSYCRVARRVPVAVIEKPRRRPPALWRRDEPGRSAAVLRRRPGRTSACRPRDLSTSCSPQARASVKPPRRRSATTARDRLGRRVNRWLAASGGAGATASETAGANLLVRRLSSRAPATRAATSRAARIELRSRSDVIARATVLSEAAGAPDRAGEASAGREGPAVWALASRRSGRSSNRSPRVHTLGWPLRRRRSTRSSAARGSTR